MASWDDPNAITNLIDTGITGTLALYSGFNNGSPINYWPTTTPAAGVPAVAAAPSAVTSGILANPWVIAIGAGLVLALFWEKK